MPVDTKSSGQLTRYEEIEPLLVEAEVRGRAWVFSQAQTPPAPTEDRFDDVVLETHRRMFGDLFDWAGQPRRVDVGPSGNCPVPWHAVRQELRLLSDDLQAWLAALPSDPTIEQVAHLIADVHHRFQWIHPFQDTNGRTGRLLDHYVLWVHFKLAGAGPAPGPIIEPFPEPNDAREYYDGLARADGYDPALLRGYYVRRVTAALNA